MALRKNSLIGIEQGIATPTRKKSRSRTGLSRIQEHIDIVKGRSPGGHDDSLRRIERESHATRPSALKITQRLDHRPVFGPAQTAHTFSIHPLPERSINDAFLNVEPFSAEIEPFDPSYGEKGYGYGLETPSVFDDGEPYLNASLPEHERPYRSATPSDGSPPGTTPFKNASPQQPAYPPYPESGASTPTVRREPSPDTVAAMSAFERDIDQMISTAKKRGDSPAIRTDSKEANPQASALSREASSNPHGIFEKMGRELQFANSFNLGRVDVVKKFDQFDRELDGPPSSPALHAQEMPFQLSAPDLADADIVFDLAEIEMARTDTGIASGFNTQNSTPPTPPGATSEKTAPPSVQASPAPALPLIQASEGLSPASAAACMLIAAKHHLPPDPMLIRSGEGGWSPYQGGLTLSEIPALIDRFGLAEVDGTGVDQAGLETALRERGPLIVTKRGGNGNRCLVVSGYREEQGVRFSTIDPQTGHTLSSTFPELVRAIAPEAGPTERITALYA